MFVDPIQDGPCGLCCHLYSLPGWEEDLQEFALKLGLKPAWFQNVTMPHYNVTAYTRARAVAQGAVEVSETEFRSAVRIWRDSREKCKAISLAGQDAEASGEIRNERRHIVEDSLTPEEISAQVADLRRRLISQKI